VIYVFVVGSMSDGECTAAKVSCASTYTVVIPLALNCYTEEAVSVFPFVRCQESMYVKRVQCSVNNIIPGKFSAICDSQFMNLIVHRSVTGL